MVRLHPKHVGLVLSGGAFVLVLVLCWLSRERIAAWYRHQTVKKLLVPGERDEALRRIIEWQRYRGEPRYRVTEVETIRHVLLCPQSRTEPIFAVFLGKKPDSEKATVGHFELIDYDGTILPVYMGANSSDSGVFQDINGDGVIDRVDSWRWTVGRSVGLSEPETDIDVLQVLPITREQQPLLRVAYNPSKSLESPKSRPDWSWEIVPTKDRDVFDVLLGPRSTPARGVDPQVTYRWDAKAATYVGPSGGVGDAFLRFTDETSEELERFAQAGGSGGGSRARS